MVYIMQNDSQRISKHAQPSRQPIGSFQGRLASFANPDGRPGHSTTLTKECSRAANR
ncbi:hypothetical protein SDC9_02700 [bioreactor metagenome]|uniref:Uncharacterized protein n=1 Tax=bioreactor metagenome TaxID=1076179 RepID=A0A644SU44_9ZZZZ